MSDKPYPSSFDDDPDFYNESRLGKIGRKIKEEPLIPIGLTATCYALYQAAISMKKGDHTRVNRMFRARIYAQAFTIVAIIGGSIYYKEDRQKRKVYNEMLALQKAQERRDAWIRELEAREQEEEDLAKKQKAYIVGMREQERKRKGEARSVVETLERPGPIVTAILALASGRS
ncbi:MAG: Respiratory supercomplex factor 1, mitochondrial [Vezdaea aestivalis]|nr:MAG: Respiratory supercomplex factor 1, mitochondrial [Vezdaea aestivalis]